MNKVAEQAALPPDDNPSLRESIYVGLRHQLITGRLAPGVAISTRGLAQQLGVSQMPVRDALGRLAAEGAVEIRSKRAIMVSMMTRTRFDDIMRCRLLLEPAAAADALPFIDTERLRAIRAADNAAGDALKNGDVNAYMESNFRFHSLIYRARPSDILNGMIETLWMQFGPFMRVVYGRYGTANLVDQHVVATNAIAEGDADALRHAIEQDIGDGMSLIREGELDEAPKA
ncbi:MAG: GntR family transcriptional regulator [Sphingomonas sp.]|nr:MAG: GntR family transcriptional regulator [Sphingomonas sp.]